MRQTLVRLWLERPWAGWTTLPDEPPRLGAAWVWLVLGALFLGFHRWRGHRDVYRDPGVWILWGGGLIALAVAPRFGFLPEWIPVFGYGMMVLLGFVTALIFTRWRAKKIGLPPEIVMDLSIWLLVGGIAGGRLAYLVQYRHEVFGRVQNFFQLLVAIVNLPDGGLVLIGAIVGGAVAALLFCRKRGLDFLDMADLLIPALFIGIGFGRIGCLLNGCCFGDRCDLPWAIVFPRGSVTFEILAERGFVDPQSRGTMPLHPTQIYSSIDGFVLAFVTAVYYWYRRYPGDVLALGCLLYSITRFLMEFLRADEMGQLGTGLTISQLYSVGIFVLGLILAATGPLRARRRHGTPLASGQ